MPTYTYSCEEGHLFEEWQKITDEPLKQCPQPIGVSDCSAPVKRVIVSAPGFSMPGGTPKFHG